jgi:hypothetical protein
LLFFLTIHYLEKSYSLPFSSLSIDELVVLIDPSLVKFESEFQKLLAEDKINWDRTEIDPSTIIITERRLKIGIHNGWKYINEPHVLYLNMDDQLIQNQIPFINKRFNLKSSFKQKKQPNSKFSYSNFLL